METPGPQVEELEEEFKSLKKGKFAERLKTEHTKVKDDDRVGPPVHEAMASVVNGFFEEAKVAGEMERLSKNYPRIKNVKSQVVPKLDAEIFNVVDQQVRGADVIIQNLQKGAMAIFLAIAPVGSLLISRGETDQDLENLSDNVFDAMHFAALFSNGLSMRRREQIRPHTQQTYAKSLTKPPEGSSAWLFGGNLSETARKCEVEKKLGEKLLRPKGGPKSNASGGQQQKRGVQGQRQNKRFKFNNNANGYGSSNNTFGDKRQTFVPQGYGQFGYQHAFPAPQQFQQFQGYGYKQTGGKQDNQGQQQKQDFLPRGARK